MLAKQIKETYHFYTEDEYLAMEEAAEIKHEYRQGNIIAMTGASINHNRIVINTATTLNIALKGSSCEVFVNDLRLQIKRDKIYTYPDVMVVCSKPSFVKNRTDTINNPKAIIEILSKSTETYDRSDKFHAYWSLDTFEEYVLIDQYRIHVEYFRRINDKEWGLRVFKKMTDILKLESIEVEIPLNDLYQNVVWEEKL